MNEIVPLPQASHQGTMQIGNVELRCFIVPPEWEFDEPQRLLSGRAVTDALSLTGRGQGMIRFVQSKTLNGHLSPEVTEAILHPVVFTLNSGIKPTHGYPARILPELCFGIMDAYVARKQVGLRTPPDRTYIQAKILAKAFSVVGIEALVDEATGFQEDRDRRALARILNQYLAKEWRPWSRMFEAEFYQEIFRLRNWQWKGMRVNRPSCVAHYTTDLIYRRLAPRVLVELKARVPKNDRGKPKRPLFCGLSEDTGVPALRLHLQGVTVLMKASRTWAEFKKLVDRAYPRFDDSPTLPGLDLEYEEDDD